MNIADILSQAAEETYNTETFEEDVTPHRDDAAPLDAATILKQSAQIVAKEEKIAAERAFAAAISDIKDEIIENSPRRDVSIREAEDILQEASKEVAKEIAKVREPSDDEPDDDEPDDDDDPKQNELLLHAAYNGKVEGVRNCLKSGAKYRCVDRHGWTPLHWAASKGYDDVIDVLLRHLKSQKKNVRGFVNMRDNLAGWTALHVACVNGHLHTVELLLRNKADKNKLTMMQEKPIECIGKFRSATSIRQLLQDEAESKESEKLSIRVSPPEDRSRNSRNRRSRSPSPRRNNRRSPSPDDRYSEYKNDFDD